jgi:hypothetical protein
MKKVLIFTAIVLFTILAFVGAAIYAYGDTTTTIEVSINNANFGIPNTYSGRIVSSPAGIDCPGTCAATFENSVGTVSLTATANADSAIYGFNSDNVQYAGAVCPGSDSRAKSGVCTFNLSSDWYSQGAYLAFIPSSTAYNFQIKGTGSGTVTGSGANCPGSCTANIPYNGAGTFTATPASDSVFSGWGTVSEGSQTCTVGGRDLNPARIKVPTCSVSNPMSVSAKVLAFFDKKDSSATPSTISSSNGTNATTSANVSQSSAKPPEKLGGEGAPAKPELNSLKVIFDGTSYGSSNIPNNGLNLNQGLSFGGTTIPNVLVYLFFHSEEFVAQTTADAAGVWSYELTKDLGAGDHELQIAVTDPATNLTSEKSEAVKFALAESTAEATAADNDNNDIKNVNLWWYVGGGVLLLLLLAVLGFYIWKNKRSKKTSLEKPKFAEQASDQKSTE